MVIQWYPGHMVKAKKEIKGNLKLIDVVIELLDARIPNSSQNPDIKEIVENKPRIIALNKADLASEHVTKNWISYFKKQGITAVPVDSITGRGLKEIEAAVRALAKDKLEKSAEKGRIGRPIRVAIIGIPNVGKSAYINKVAGRSAAITANKPGVTKQNQWVKAGQGIELMDTPGVLWPKFESEEAGISLAVTGAIRSEILDIYELAVKLMDILKRSYAKNLIERFRIENIEGMTGEDIVQKIGSKRGCIIGGGEVDLERTSNLIIEEFRSGKIGRISLEEPTHP
ncbi:MAG: ribosome biogenesis GTPase YlqF [Deltaproteobacteria bacterium]